MRRPSLPTSVRARSRRFLALSPSSYRRITAGAAWALAVIVVSGGAVRLTGSGLGCPDWPTCSHHRVVAPWEYHAMVEFVNRAFTGAVSLAVVLAVLGSVVRRPRRLDLVWLSWGLVAGVLGQIVLGGLTVKFRLAPPFVMGHFLLSMLILADAVVLHHRAGLTDRDALQTRSPSSAPGVSGPGRARGRLIVAATGLVLVLGTVVTSSGPHGGDPRAERLPFLLHDVARLHGTAVMALVALVALTAAQLWRSGAPAPDWRAAEVLLGVLVAQAAVGYVQYFTGVPVLLVGVHLAGAAAV
ncbi:MAG: COX15/CtaA family protein, partial [Acidimicrobiales bacterium]